MPNRPFIILNIRSADLSNPCLRKFFKMDGKVRASGIRFCDGCACNSKSTYFVHANGASQCAMQSNKTLNTTMLGRTEKFNNILSIRLHKTMRFVFANRLVATRIALAYTDSSTIALSFCSNISNICDTDFALLSLFRIAWLCSLHGFNRLDAMTLFA